MQLSIDVRLTHFVVVLVLHVVWSLNVYVKLLQTNKTNGKILKKIKERKAKAKENEQENNKKRVKNFN